MIGNPCVIFDRDGTLIDHVHHLTDKNKVKVKKEAFEALNKLVNSNFTIGVITNQSVIGRNLATKELVEEINSYISEIFAGNCINLAFFLYCPHTPNKNCNCRKPQPELGLKVFNELNIIAKETYVVGDQYSDVEFAKNLGSKSILLQAETPAIISVDFQAVNLLDAVNWIINDWMTKK